MLVHITYLLLQTVQPELQTWVGGLGIKLSLVRIKQYLVREIIAGHQHKALLVGTVENIVRGFGGLLLILG